MEIKIYSNIKEDGQSDRLIGRKTVGLGIDRNIYSQIDSKKYIQIDSCMDSLMDK